MESLWSDSEAIKFVNSLKGNGVSEDLAWRVYTTRLLGLNPKLVLHGGGNTSLKTVAIDVFGEYQDVICVKGSGSDMAYIQPGGLPAVRLEPLLKLKRLDSLSDDSLVNFERSNLMDSMAPTPSIETLFHAYIPHKFVDHTHANAILSLTNQDNAVGLCEEIFKGRVGIVPYIKPGFELARIGHQVYEKSSNIDGLVLLKHGIFTFGDSAQESYRKMIDLVTLVEGYLAKGNTRVFQSAYFDQGTLSHSELGPLIRGAFRMKDKLSFDGNARFVLDFRTGAIILNYVALAMQEGNKEPWIVTPDHTIRTKNWPLLLPSLSGYNLETYRGKVVEAVDGFVEKYHAYFDRYNANQENPKIELDPFPRVVLAPGVGLFGVGRTSREASIAADIAEGTIDTIADASGIGVFQPFSESDLFEVEYWSLEQAKLGRSYTNQLSGCVVIVTGGAGAIGTAIAKEFAGQGAEVALLDIDYLRAVQICEEIGLYALPVECDVTDSASVKNAFDTVCRRFGGVDIVVSNAGAPWQGKIAELPERILRDSFDLNFFSHQSVAQNAIRVMRMQDIGGVLLFNVSKQAVNPGESFGAYGLPKAAALFLVRQYALENGRYGIRANAVNADRIRSGILTPKLISERSMARGVSEEDYMKGNLLGTEVMPQDVAKAFLHQALQTKTTADVTTVDGGNISASLR